MLPLCPTLCEPMGCRPPGYSVRGILQARTPASLRALALAGGFFLTLPGDLPNPGLPHCRWSLHQLSHQGSPGYWSGSSVPSPGDLPGPRMEPGLPGGSADEFSCSAGDLGSIPGLGRYPGEWNSYPLQYSGLENSMDYIVHGVAKSRTRLSNFHFSLPLAPPGKPV